jgi:hypothetical protein
MRMVPYLGDFEEEEDVKALKGGLSGFLKPVFVVLDPSSWKAARAQVRITLLPPHPVTNLVCLAFCEAHRVRRDSLGNKKRPLGILFLILFMLIFFI